MPVTTNAPENPFAAQAAEAYERALQGGFAPTVDEVYSSALAEHSEFAGFDKAQLSATIRTVLGEIALFEELAREPLVITPPTAEKIGTLWVHSGTGNYDAPFKPEDNPRYLDKPWTAGWDRARLDHAMRLAIKIAEARSGQTVESSSLTDNPAAKALIAAYGPTIFYSGYPSETQFAERLFARDGIVMPSDKVKVLQKELEVTADAVRNFEYPDDPAARTKEVAIISHAPHLARIIHMVNLHQPLTPGSIPYMAPLPTPEVGRKEFALMEARGALYYMLLRHEATQDAYPYQLFR